MLLVLAVKAAASEAALKVTDLGMRACGGAAFSRQLGLERHFRDARAPRRDGADHRSGLRVHRPGAVRHGAVLDEATSRSRRRRPLRPEGLGDLGHHQRLLRRRRAVRSTCVFYTNYELQVTRCSTGTSTSPGTRPWPGWTPSAAPGDVPGHRHARHRPRPRVAPRRARGRAASRALDDLRGRTVAAGAKDSPQATLIPLGLLQRQRARAADAISGCGASTCWSASTATTSAASGTPCERLQRGEARRLRRARPELGAWTADGTVDPTRVRVLATTEPLRPLRLHRARRTSRRGARALAGRAVLRCATTTPPTAR